jgi:putative membrane protein
MTDRVASVTIAVLSLVVVGLVAALMARGGTAAPAAFDVSALPLLNACLNAMSAALLVTGWIFIRRRRFTAHIASMLGAFAMSTLFLISYVTYHYHAGSRPFTGQGVIRPIYFALLITHIVLAAAIVPLALTTIYKGWRAIKAHTRAMEPRPRHVATHDSARVSETSNAATHDGARVSAHIQIARWTLPIWLYVSVTGVLVYWLLHKW